MSVKTQHKQYDEYLPMWTMARDAAAGEKAVHAAGTTYLPKLHKETDQSYQARKARTAFFNATWRTISGLHGMLLRKPPELDVAASLNIEDIDAAGSTIYEFAGEVIEEALTVGRVGLMVDYPEAIDLAGKTVAQVQASGVRPAINIYEAESIINWREARINNQTVLSMVVLKEQHIEPDGFEVIEEDRYRVLNLENGQYRQRLFRIDNKGNDELISEFYPLMNNQPMTYIPFFFISTDCNRPEVDAPPLIDLITMNLHHYRVSADYENGCHISGLPTMFISGFRPDDGQEIYIGGATANTLPQPDAKAYYVEVGGDYSALRTNLDEKKGEMAVLGARMLEGQRKGVESAEVAAQHRKGEESLLSQVAQSISKGLSKALSVYSEWSGMGDKAKLDLNRDFLPAKMTSIELTAMVSAWQQGAISANTLFDNLKQGEIVDEDVTFEEEQARISESQPQLMAPVLDQIAQNNSAPTQQTDNIMPEMQAKMQEITTSIDALTKTINASEPDNVNINAQVADAMVRPISEITKMVNDMQTAINAMQSTPAPVATAPQVVVLDRNGNLVKQIKFNMDADGNPVGATVTETVA